MATSNQDTSNHDKQKANKDATEKMARNQELQDSLYQQSQNKKTGNTPETEHLLGNDTEDSLPVKEQNRNKLKTEKNEDFGGEQLQ